MAVEIERKFLLADDTWRRAVDQSEPMAQGYLTSHAALQQGLDRASVRVRVAGDRAWLNIKSATLGIERLEFELPLACDDAKVMLEQMCTGRVDKVRHHVRVDGWLFEIDEFGGDNAGLIVAEIELPHTDAVFPRPAWLGREVSHLERYFNVSLGDRPFREWSAAERAGEEIDAC
jgi:adenylate cyclase